MVKTAQARVPVLLNPSPETSVVRGTFVTLHSSGIKGHANFLERVRASFLDTPLSQRLTSPANAWKTSQDTHCTPDFGGGGSNCLSLAA